MTLRRRKLWKIIIMIQKIQRQKRKRKKSLPAPIFLSGGMRTGNLYGGTAKDNNGFSSNKNYSNNNRNKISRSKHGNYGNSSPKIMKIIIAKIVVVDYHHLHLKHGK